MAKRYVTKKRMKRDIEALKADTIACLRNHKILNRFWNENRLSDDSEQIEWMIAENTALIDFNIQQLIELSIMLKAHRTRKVKECD